MNLEDIPRVNWPSGPSSYKVVQLEIDGQPYLRFEEANYYTHGLIIDTLLRKLGIKYDQIKGMTGSWVPALEGERYKVKGMGRAVMLTGNKVSFLGNSVDYGLGIDRDHLDAIKALESERGLIY